MLGIMAMTIKKKFPTKKPTVVFLVGALIIVSAIGIAAAVFPSDALVEESFPITKNVEDKTFSDGSSFTTDSGKKWNVIFSGFGTVSITKDWDTSGYLQLSPAVATDPSQTHGALVVSEDKADKEHSCVNISHRIRTEKQLRTGSSPNPWEMAWTVWDYQDPEHFMYFIPKTNGWELGKRDPAYPGGQRFLASGSTSPTSVGQWRSIDTKRNVNTDGASTTTVTIDGKQVTQVIDGERPYVSGAIGLYSEDAIADADVIKAVYC